MTRAKRRRDRFASLTVNLRGLLQERQYATPYHWSYDRNNLLEYQLRTRIVHDLLGLSSADGSVSKLRLLDVGCGDARFLGDASQCTAAHGVDASERALGFARQRVPRARFASCGAEALCFPDETFDAMTLLDVIEHIPDEQEFQIVREAHRVLRPGGQLVISTNTDRTAVEWKHYRHYSVARFRLLFEGLFSDLRLVGLIPYFPTLRLWKQMPIVWRFFRGRVRTCAPEEGQVVVGVGRKMVRPAAAGSP